MMLYHTRSIAIVVITILCTFCVQGCCKKPEIPKPVSRGPFYGGIYRRALSYKYIVLDPAKIKDNNSQEVARQIYDGLVGFDERGNITPSIARNWIISEDKKVYTFYLRADVVFHGTVCSKPTKNGGRAINSKDVVYTFKRLLSGQKDFQGGYFSVLKGAEDFTLGKTKELEGVKAIDDHTVEFTLEKPFAPFLSLLAMGNAFIVPEEDAENGSLEECPVGSGPFIWAGRQNDVITLKANANYYLGRPWLDQIEFPVIVDVEERFKAFKAGKLSLVDVPDSVYTSVKQDEELSKCLIETNLWGVNYFGFRTTLKPFDNVWVRKAINYAIDKDNLIRCVLNNKDLAAQGILPPGILGYDENYFGYKYDIEKAKECLAKAGYPNGKGMPKIMLSYNKDTINQRMVEFVQANLCDAGIDCGLKSYDDFGEYLNAIETDQCGFFRIGWTADYPDPDALMYPLFHSSNIQNASNYTCYQNSKVDELLKKARFETKTKERIDLYRETEKAVVMDAPGVFLHFYSVNLLTRPEVKDLKVGPMGEAVAEYRHIWLNNK